MKNKFLLIVSLLILNSCISKRTESTKNNDSVLIEKSINIIPEIEIEYSEDTVSMNWASDEDIAKMKENILSRGDTNSYKSLMIIMLDYHPKEGVYWAKFMSQNYNYNRAYHDVYLFTSWIYEDEGMEFHKLDKQAQKYLIYNLKKATELGLKEAEDDLKRLGY